MRAFFDEAVRGFLADAGAGANDDDDLARQLFLGGHTLQLRLFEQPVFDVERLLLRKRNVSVDRLGAAHDFNRAVVELSGHAALGLVLAPRDQADAGDEHHGGIRVAHRGRVGVFALLVIGGVVLAVSLEAGGKFLLQRRGVFGLRIPVHVKRLDLRAEKMVGAARAKFGEAGGVLRVHEAQNLLVVLHGADEALGLGNLTAEPREDRGEGRATLLGREGLVFRAAESRGVAALGLILGVDERGSLLDAVERVGVAGLLVVVPRDEAVLAHHDRLHLRVGAADFLHREAEFEAGAHPLHVRHFAAEDFLREFLAVLRGRDRDDRVRVHVIDELRRDEAVQRRVDRRGAWVQVERRVAGHADHLVFGGGLQALVGTAEIELLHAEQFFLIKGGEVLAGAGA